MASCTSLVTVLVLAARVIAAVVLLQALYLK